VEDHHRYDGVKSEAVYFRYEVGAVGRASE
jgi:hypothetical protein